MRCIDADALEELFREVIGGIAKKPEMNGNLEHMVRASAMVVEMIQDAPTIEPRCETCEAFNKTRLLIPQPERKKGEWIPVTKIYKVTEGQFPNTHIEWVDTTDPDKIDAVRCSECREVFDFQDARNWCTECGADMREDAEEPKKCDTCLHEKEPWSMQCHRCEDYNLWEAKE